jgi:multidrug resistance protein MdtO
MTAAPAIPWLSQSRFWAFLSREMAPTPGRWESALRVTLACVICTIPVMAFHLQEALLVMVFMFVISKEDTTTTLLGTVLGIIGFTIGCTALLFFYLCVVDLEWLRVLTVPTIIALGLFLNRVITLGPLGTTISLPLALGMVIPDAFPSPEFLNREPFYLWRAGVLGLCVNLAVQYLLNPTRSHSIIMHGLAARLNAVEILLRRRVTGETVETSHTPINALAFSGAAEQLHLLKLASIVEPLLKQHRIEITGQIILVDRLVTAAAALENRPTANDTDSDKRRMLRLADESKLWREAINERRAPNYSALPLVETSAVSYEARPLLKEMERVIRLLPEVFHGDKLPAELTLPPARQDGALVADAFTNPVYMRFAVKGALAALICYLIFTMFAYQGIYTSVITCIVCSLSTIGASVQKGILRLAGAVVGGLLGVVALMFVLPHLDSLAGFWFPFGAVTALAAYVHFGSPRISYCGYQIGVAFYKCTLQSYGTYTELRVVRDRLVGIALGLIVFQIVNSCLWPVSTFEIMRTKLADLLRLLAGLTRLPDDQKDPAPQMAEAFALRLQAYKNFATFDELRQSMEFEPGAPSRNRFEAASQKTKTLFLNLLAILQHRTDLRPGSVPESIRASSARFRTTLSDLLDALSNRDADRVRHGVAESKAALAGLEQTVAADISGVRDPAFAGEIHGRLALYQEAAAIAVALSELQIGETIE